MRLAVPVVEVAGEKGVSGIGGPLPVCDGAIGIDVEPKDIGTLGEFVDAAFGLVQLGEPILRFGISPLESVLERLEPGVELDDACAVIAGASRSTSSSGLRGQRVGGLLDNGSHGRGEKGRFQEKAEEK